MRRILQLSIVLILAAFAGHAQSPPGINYQGVARNPDGKPLALRDITIRINILKDGGNGDIEYAEVHSVKTNSFGLFTLVIGTGNVDTGDFRFISWAVGNKWLRVEMDPDGGSSFQLMGSQQFMSVPYAFYAKFAGNSLTAGQGISITNNVVSNTGDADNNPANEYNTGFTFGVDRKLRIIDGGGTKEVDLGSLASGDIVQDLRLTGNKLSLDNNPSATEIDLAPYLDDKQNLALSGTMLSIDRGNNVDLSGLKQSLSYAGTNLSISNGNTVDLANLKQDLSSSASGTNRTIGITNGTSTTIDVADNDNSSINELQNLSFAGTALSISGGTGVNLSPLRQDLSSSASGINRTINISNGSSTTIDVADTDNDITNEIQNLSLSIDNTLSLSKSASPVDLTRYIDDTDEQRLSLNGTNNTTLTIDRGNSVNLDAFMDDTDDQNLTLTGHSLSLDGDPTPVDLTPYADDKQNLSLTAAVNNRTINITGGTGVTFSVADGDADATNELQSLAYNAGTKSLSITPGNAVTIAETQNMNQVLMQGNDAGGQRITNIGAPTANTDAVTKQYVDNADAAINTRLSANYAFKTNFTFSTLLTGASNVPLPLAGESFDDFNVVNASNFTAQAAGTYVFTVDGDISSLLVGSTLSVLYNGTKYPVSVGSNNRYNTTLMFRLTVGQTVSLVADGIGINTNINGSFFGYKLP